MEMGPKDGGHVPEVHVPSRPISRAEPGYGASRLAGPASDRRKESPERKSGNPRGGAPQPCLDLQAWMRWAMTPLTLMLKYEIRLVTSFLYFVT